MTPYRLPSLAVVTAVVVVVALAAGPDRGVSVGAAVAASSGDRSATSARFVPTPKRAVLRLRKTRFGRVIHEKRSGLVAYLFTRDRRKKRGRKKTRCKGACAKAWPPIKTKRRPRAGSGLKRKHLRTIRRPGGAKQLTYKGRPLYFYEHDSPGVILCQNVREFGGDWFVVKRSGKPA